MLTALLYIPAAFAEIAGCFSFWAWLRAGKTPLWLVPGMGSLALFAWLLTFSPAEQAGRAYAIYGGVYILASFLWAWVVEGVCPTKTDIVGCVVCLVGAAIILFGSKLT